MKASFEIAFHYLKYYKNKSFSILFSIILAVSLIVGIGTMYNSAKYANIEKIRMETSDFHFFFYVNQKQLNIIKSSNLEKYSITKDYDAAKDPNFINFVQIDTPYIKMNQSNILRGNLPTKEDEIALEEWVIRNLNIKSKIGEKITFRLEKAKKNQTFTLVGILKDMPLNKVDDKMEGYLNLEPNLEKMKVYVKFNEDNNIKKQLNLLLAQMNYGDKNIGCNRSLLDALHVQTYIPPLGTYESFRGIIELYHLDLVGIIFIITLFSSFVIYSVFQISTMQRISDYGLLEALGSEKLHLFTILISELMMLFLIGFPIGTIIGILSAKLLNKKFSSVFIGQEVRTNHLYISLLSIFIGALILFILLLFITKRTMKKLNKFTPIEAIQKNYKSKYSNVKDRKIYTLRKTNITHVISLKYMIRKKSAFVGILLSLSLGGILFICSSYASELKKENNNLSIKVDNDLNSDYQIGMQFTDFDKGITEHQINELGKITGVAKVSPISFYFGGIILDDDRMISKKLFDDNNKIPYIKNSFGGMYTKINNRKNDYLLRTGIYGYDNYMLNMLKDYVLDGSINANKMKQSNLVLFKQWQNGGNGLYDMVDVKPGDTIIIKFQKSPKLTERSLKFKDGPEYVEKKFIVGATLKRVASSNEYFIGDSGGDIIMTNEQFKKTFGMNTYNMVSITKQKIANHVNTANSINEVIKNIPLCSMRDLTIEIESNNAFVNKQLLFLYGVTFILFIISLCNILNSISYNVLSKTNEFGVLRAMGITDEGILRMILREGFLYGIFANIITVLGSLLGQGIVLFFVKYSYLYIDPHFTIHVRLYLVIIVLNIIIGMLATIIPSKNILRMSIVDEIKKFE